MQRVLNFSGGKTSAYMVLKYWREGDIVLFTDTGREHPKTYKFINDFEAFEGIPVIRISFLGVDDPFVQMLVKRKYKVIPNRVKRICTDELKIKTAKRYLTSLKIFRYENIIGFRFDEPKRVKRHIEKYKKVVTKFPLFEDQITKNDIESFWSKKDYTLEIPSILGNCDLCFMKGKNAIINILTVYPELADKWIDDEEKAKQINGPNNRKGTSGRQYFPDVTMKQLKEIAQNNLFNGKIDLAELVPAFNCACTT